VQVAPKFGTPGRHNKYLASLQGGLDGLGQGGAATWAGLLYSIAVPKEIMVTRVFQVVPRARAPPRHAGQLLCAQRSRHCRRFPGAMLPRRLVLLHTLPAPRPPPRVTLCASKWCVGRCGLPASRARLGHAAPPPRPTPALHAPPRARVAPDEQTALGWISGAVRVKTPDAAALPSSSRAALRWQWDKDLLTTHVAVSRGGSP